MSQSSGELPSPNGGVKPPLHQTNPLLGGGPRRCEIKTASPPRSMDVGYHLAARLSRAAPSPAAEENTMGGTPFPKSRACLTFLAEQRGANEPDHDWRWSGVHDVAGRRAAESLGGGPLRYRLQSQSFTLRWPADQTLKTFCAQSTACR